MKKIIITCFFLALLLTQSCVVYQKSSVSLDQAYNSGRVKVISKKGAEIIFKEIVLEDSVYYGVNRNNKISNIPLNTTSIYLIFLKDINKSKRRTGFFMLGIVISIPILLVIPWFIKGMPVV